MANILCITSGLTGILNASYEVASRLQAVGHTCFLSSPAKVKGRVIAHGFNFLQLKEINFDPAPTIPNYTGPLKKINRLFYKYVNAKSRRAQSVEALGMDSLLGQIEKIKPDLILIDIELHEHIMTLVTSKYKVLLLSQWFSTWKRNGLPPIVQDTIPRKGFFGSKVGLMLQWKSIQLERWWMFFKKKLVSAGTDRRSILKLYAKKVGFSKDYIRENYWPGPFSYDVLPVISMTSKEMDFPHVERKNHTYVGPMVYEQRKNNGIREADSVKIVELLTEKKKNNNKLIYCSVSTFLPGDICFLNKVIKAFETREEWMLLIGLGGLVDSDLFSNLPANVHPFRQVPQLQVLAEADLSINHGGIHTINECVHFEVPMLIYSGKKSDQNGCAARMHYHGLGMMADKDADTPFDIHLKISQMLANDVNFLKTQKINIYNKGYKIDQVVEGTVNAFLNK